MGTAHEKEREATGEDVPKLSSTNPPPSGVRRLCVIPKAPPVPVIRSVEELSLPVIDCDDDSDDDGDDVDGVSEIVERVASIETRVALPSAANDTGMREIVIVNPDRQTISVRVSVFLIEPHESGARRRPTPMPERDAKWRVSALEIAAIAVSFASVASVGALCMWLFA